MLLFVVVDDHNPVVEEPEAIDERNSAIGNLRLEAKAPAPSLGVQEVCSVINSSIVGTLYPTGQIPLPSTLLQAAVRKLPLPSAIVQSVLELMYSALLGVMLSDRVFVSNEISN